MVAVLIGIAVLPSLFMSPNGWTAPREGPDRAFTVEWEVSAPPTKRLTSIWLAPDGETGAAIGDGGTMLWSEDGGKTWAFATKPSGLTDDLRAMTFIDAKVGIVVGNGGTILRSEDGGKIWSRSTVAAQVKADLQSVAFGEDGLSGIAVGDGALVLYTLDGGKSWSTAGVPVAAAREPLKFVTFAGANVAIAGGSSGSVLRTEDAGKTWSLPVLSLLPDFDLTFEDINGAAFANTQLGLMVGGSATVLRTVDGGKSWTQIFMPGDTTTYLGVAFADPSTAVIVGDYGTLWRSTDEGKTWQKNTAPPFDETSSALSLVIFTGPELGLVLGEDGTVLQTGNRGVNWEEARTPGVEDILAGSFLDLMRGLTAGTGGAIFRTGDGGLTWSRAVLPVGMEPDFRDSAFAGNKTVVAVGLAGTIRVSDDEGKTWLRAETPPDASENLHSVSFADALTGVAVGDRGTVLVTEDGGHRWTRAVLGEPVTANLHIVIFTDAKTGIALGNRSTILWSADGGREWRPAAKLERSILSFSAAALLNAKIAVAVTGRSIMRTEDGGETWWEAEMRDRNSAPLADLAFADGATGVAVGRSGAIFLTDDAGKSWSRASIWPKVSTDLLAVTFSGPLSGVAVGKKGIVLRTDDGGKNWTQVRQAPDGQADLNAVAFDESGTGFIVGTRGTIWASRDEGRSWHETKEPKAIDNAVLNRLAAVRDGPLVIVGTAGVRLKAGKRNFAPFVSNATTAVRLGLDGRIDLDMELIDEEGNEVRAGLVEFSVVREKRDRDWRPIGSAPVKSASDGHWRVSWSPGDERIDGGSTIEHRVFLDDGGPPLSATVLNPVVFRPWWAVFADYPAASWAVAGSVSLIGLYLLPILLQLWLAPARLALAGNQALEVADNASELSPGWSKAISKLFRQLTLPWFKSRPRVRRAWLKRYSEKGTRFDELAKEVREKFLREADVVDAWVSKRLPAARQALNQLSLYSARKTYIPFPVHVGDAGDTIDQPSPSNFNYLFDRERVILPIVGGGGSGKTTLACALARWALAEDPAQRLQTHAMIPVFIAEEVDNDLMSAITAQLYRMLGSEKDLEPEIISALLRSKRVVVIVDALSERSTEMQRYIERYFGADTPVTAMIVTTRSEPDFGPAERTLLRPDPIDLRLLVPFILEYLNRKGLARNFTPDQQLDLAKRILQIVDEGGGFTVTPLFVTLFVDAAIEWQGTLKGMAGLPVNVPEIFLNYLDRLNPSDPATPNRVDRDVLYRAARILAKTSLGRDCVPKDFHRSDAEKSLTDAGIAAATAVTNRLIANGVVQERQVATVNILRFQLDPVAEYLSAIDECHRLGGDAAAWQKAIAELEQTDGYPDAIRGYLIALHVCHTSYKIALKLAPCKFPWAQSAKETSPQVAETVN